MQTGRPRRWRLALLGLVIGLVAAGGAGVAGAQTEQEKVEAEAALEERAARLTRQIAELEAALEARAAELAVRRAEFESELATRAAEMTARRAEMESRMSRIGAEQARRLHEVRAFQERARAQDERSRHEAQARVRLRAARAPLPPGAFRGTLAPLMGRLFGHGGGLSPERVLQHADELELTDEQQERIRSMHRQHRRDGIERTAAIEVAELDLDELTADVESADLAAVEAKMLEISRLRVQERVAELRLRQEVSSVLSAEQRDKLDEMGPNVFFRREGGPRGEFSYAPEGGSYWFDDEDGRGWALELDDRFFGHDGDEWPGRIWFEKFEEAPEFRFWFRDHDDEDSEAHPEHDEEGAASGAASKTEGVKTEVEI